MFPQPFAHIGLSLSPHRSDVILEANSIPLLIAFLASEDDETAFLAVRAIMRCIGTVSCIVRVVNDFQAKIFFFFFFPKAISNNNHYRVALLNEEDRSQYCLTLDTRSAAAASQLMVWANSQYARVGSELARLAGHKEGGVAIPAIGALSELMALMHEAAGERAIPLQKDWISKVEFCLLFSHCVPADAKFRRPISWDMSVFDLIFGLWRDFRP